MISGVIYLKKTRFLGHKPVKWALIGSKGRWKLTTIFMLKSDSRLVNNTIGGGKSYLLDGYIFAALFETTSLCFCCLGLLVWLRKK